MATAETIPPATALAALPADEKTRVLDLLFEPSPDLHAIALPLLQSSCPTYPALIGAVGEQLTARAQSSTAADLQLLDGILGSHPRLGARTIASAQSQTEQAQLQQGPAGEAERLAALNADYESTFPGLRYVVFVNGRGRDVIMADMQRRIARGDQGQERIDAIQAMCDIAQDRSSKLQTAPA